MKYLSVILIVISFIFVFPVVGTESVSVNSVSSTNKVSLTITDAYYTDLDGDDVLDVVGKFDVIFDGPGRHNIIIDATLTLPSGDNFTYEWIISSQLSEVSLRIDFYDHALESGYYSLDIQVTLLSGGIASGSAVYEFDPPGSSGGGDPLAELSVE